MDCRGEITIEPFFKVKEKWKMQKIKLKKLGHCFSGFASFFVSLRTQKPQQGLEPQILRSAFLPQNGLRKAFSCIGLKWKVESRNRRVSFRCDAAVAEKEEATDAPGEKFEYQAEVSRLMDLIVHSLYSDKEVFLRELVRALSLLGDAAELQIRIKPDPDNGTFTILDTGIGMTKEELIDCLGTIAQSGTSKFLKALKENKDLGADNGLIGQFGVGFYSAFLVAEKVVVSTKSPRSDKQYVWEVAADSSSYVIKEETIPENLIQRGTQITLYLRPDDKYEFSEPARIEGLVKNYSQFVSFPIYTWQEKSRTVEVEEEEEPKEGGEPKPEGEKKKKTKTEKYWDWELANETKPIWVMRSICLMCIYFPVIYSTSSLKKRKLFRFSADAVCKGSSKRGVSRILQENF
ncbi:unnamed protein product [Malus baccata var. baccata]